MLLAPLLGQLSYHLGGDSRYHAVVRHILGDDRSGGNHDVAADVHASGYDAVAADPHVIADRDGLADRQPLAPALWLHRMARRGDERARSHHAVVPEGHRRSVEDGHVKVCREVPAHADVLAVIAVESGLDVQPVPSLPEQLACRRLAALRIQRIDGGKGGASD